MAKTDGNHHVVAICEAVTTSLLPFLEPRLPQPLTRESEKSILLALSQVSKLIRKWSEGHKLASDQDILANNVHVHGCCVKLELPFDSDCRCLANTITIFVGLLGYCNGYVNHLVEKVLVTVSNSLIDSVGIWIKFIELLWVVLHAAMSSLCLFSSSFSAGVLMISYEDILKSMNIHLTSLSGMPTHNISSFLSVLNLSGVSMSCKTTASLFKLLRTILKYLDDEHYEIEESIIYIYLFYIQKIPWESYNEFNATQDLTTGSDDTLCRMENLSWLGILLGTILQLLCSLVSKEYSEHVDKGKMCSKLIDLLPLLLSSSCNVTKGGKSVLSQYIKHKILRLMIKLSSYLDLDVATLFFWLNSLKNYFHDTLYIIHSSTGPEGCLEGSPFLSTLCKGSSVHHNLCSRHLQRQAIYLFLKCCFRLSHISNVTCQHNSCGLQSSKCDCQPPAYTDYNSGLSEISEWFHNCCQNDISFTDRPAYFALSFLELFMEEDDLLFNMLLELLDASRATPQNLAEKSDSELTCAAVLRGILNPVLLFHMLLLQLKYDHLVLVDFLISKDVGVQCAQYLLRCLKIVFQSWDVFADYTVCLEMCDLSKKRRRTYVETSKTEVNPVQSKAALKVNNICWMPSKLFCDAKECMFSLKKKVEDLHQKNQFPYTPTALIRSLSRFEARCIAPEMV